MPNSNQRNRPGIVDAAVAAAAVALGPGAEFRPCDLAIVSKYSLGRVAAAVGRLTAAGTVEFCRVAKGGCVYRVAIPQA